MENYLNTINLGAGTYGVQAAAQTYFSYKPYSLANNGLTADQKALVKNYSASMVPSSSSVSTRSVTFFLLRAPARNRHAAQANTLS